MSSNTSVSPVNVANPCKCGHDYLRHTSPAGPRGTAACQDCPGNNAHLFTSINEAEPSVDFQEDSPRGYYVSGGLGKGGVNLSGAITSGVGNTPGVTSILFAGGSLLTSGAVIGGTVMFFNGSQQQQYEIVNIPDATHLVIPSPGIVTTIPPGQTPLFFGRRGSTQGAGLPANGQRAG